LKSAIAKRALANAKRGYFEASNGLWRELNLGGNVFFHSPPNGCLVEGYRFFFFMLGNPMMCQSLQHLLDVVH